MRGSSDDGSAIEAPRACSLCKQKKRKCDKKRPECSACVLRKQDCAYAPDGERNNELQRQQPVQTALRERVLKEQPDGFPKAFFLDSDFCYLSGLEIPSIRVSIPAEILSLVGGFSETRAMASSFFQTIHSWLPIISRQHFYHHILNPLVSLSADTTLLLLSMKLVVSSHQELTDASKNPLYLAVKRLFLELEISGALTIQLLQAGVLISVYEFGNAIYPSAYISIGVCARYGTILAVNSPTSSAGVGGRNWVELEVQRRIWWAILALERIINLGCPRRHLRTENPKADDILPIDDEVWNQGLQPPVDAAMLSSPWNINMGGFARLAQVTYLLGKVFRNISDSTLDKSFRAEEMIQLDRTLRALVDASEVEEKEMRQMAVCGETAVCYSALVTLHCPQFPNEISPSSESSFHNKVWKFAEDALKDTWISCQLFNQGLSQSLEKISPFSLHWLYITTLVYFLRSREDGSQESFKACGVLKNTLKLLNGRWSLAGAYLELVEAREVTWMDRL